MQIRDLTGGDLPLRGGDDNRVSLRPGQFVALVELAVGPWRGCEIASIEARPGAYAKALREVRDLAPEQRRAVARSVASAIRTRVESRSIRMLSPENDGPLMGDILLLGALREVLGDAVLREAGVLRLSVRSPERPDDGSGPWLTQIVLSH